MTEKPDMMMNNEATLSMLIHAMHLIDQIPDEAEASWHYETLDAECKVVQALARAGACDVEYWAECFFEYCVPGAWTVSDFLQRATSVN